MKKIISVSVSFIIISLAIASNVSAQSSDKGLAFGAIKNNPGLAVYVANSISADKSSSSSTKESLMAAEKDIKSSKAILKAMKANFRATENFKKTFKDVPDASWTVGDHTIVASFKKAGIKTDVVYDRKGFQIHSLTSFPADKTPANIRSIVESDYPNEDITCSVQVKEGDIDFFIVNMEDKRTIKQVSVYNGETNLITNLRKSL